METENRNAYRPFHPLRLVGLIFLAVGLIFLLTGAFIYDRQKADAQKLEEGTGYIVEFSARGYPFVMYELDGQWHMGQLNYTSSDWKVGDQVPVRFDPRVPEHVEAGGWAALFLPILFMSMGAIFALMGGALLLLQRRVQQESETTYWQA